VGGAAESGRSNPEGVEEKTVESDSEKPAHGISYFEFWGWSLGWRNREKAQIKGEQHWLSEACVKGALERII